MLPPPAVLAPPDDLLQDLLDVSLTGVMFYTPLYGPDNVDEVIDFAIEYLNPAAQRLLTLPAVPTQTHLELWPHSLEQGAFRFHVEAFLHSDRKVCCYEANYPADGHDRYHRLQARRSGRGLLVSFLDTADQPYPPGEVALREAQAAEQAARANADAQRQELVRLFEQAPVALAVFEGPQYVVEMANPAVLQLWGRTAAQTLGTPLFELLPEISGQGFRELLDEVRATGVPHVAHEMPSTIDRDGRHDTVHWNFVYQPRRDATGQVTGITVVAADVSEQVQARQQLEQLNQKLEAQVQARTRQVREHSQRLERLFMQAPASICMLAGPDLVYELVNPFYQQHFPGRQLLGQPLLAALPELADHAAYRTIQQVFETGKANRQHELHTQLARPDGVLEDRYWSYVQQPRYDAQGGIDGIVVFGFEVTKQVLARQQNEALQAQVLAAARQQALEREAFYQAFEQTTAAVALLRGPNYRFEYVNPAYQAFYPDRQLVGLDLVVANPEVVGVGFVAVLDRVYRTGETFYGREVPMTQPPDQPSRPAYFNFSYQAFREAGETVGIYVVAYDVTEQVLARQQNEALQAQLLAAARQQVQEREAFYQVFEQTGVVVALLRGPSHRFEYVNPAYQAFNPGRQLVGLDVAVATPEVVEPGFITLLDQVYQTGETFYGREVPFTPPPAPGQAPRPAYFNFTYQAYREAGEIVGISIFATDVTEQVQARHAQEAQSQELEQLFRQAPSPIVILDGPNLTFQLINPAYQRIFPGRELAGKPLLEALPELVGTTIPDLFAQVYRTGEPVTVQEMPLMMARHEGAALEQIYWTFTYQARRDAQGAIDGVRVFAYDVTEQVGARQQLHRLNQEAAALNAQLRDFNAALEQQVAERTQTLQQNRDLLQSIFDTNFTALLVLTAERDAHGTLRDFRVQLSNDEAARQTGRADLVGQPYPRLFPGLFELLRRALETGESPQREFFSPADGSPHWYNVLVVKLGDGVVVTSLDITTRKLAEQERLHNLALLEQAETVAGMGSWDFDRASGQLRWSDGLYRLFGLTPGEEFIQPARFFDYVVPEDRPVVERLLVYLTAGQGPFGETLRLHVGEQVKTVRLQAAVLPAAEEPGRVLGVYLDISEVQRLTADSLRLRQQQALFEAVQQAQETERRRIAEGLHNGVGQTLFATKLRLDQLHAPELHTAPALVAARREADKLLADAIRQIRALSHELVPQVLQEFGLAVALQNVCRQLSTPALRLHCHVLLDEQVPPLPPLLELAVYRMAQELGLNIVKHARGATQASLELETTPGFVLLRAEDDGPGFAQDPATSSGLGLRTIRDRVALLGGMLELGHHAGQGTFVRLRIPLPSAPTAPSAPSL